jgi:plasmid stability protein
MEIGSRLQAKLFFQLLAVAVVGVLLTPYRASPQPVFRAEEGLAAGTAVKGRSQEAEKIESCLVRGRPVRDFKLRDIVSGSMVTFLQAARRDYTFLLYLNAASRDSLESLDILERLRDSHRDRVGLVAVFLDPASEKDLLRFLIAHQIYPDFALHDPAFNQARCYGIARTPVLHVIDPDGQIIFTVSSTRPVDLAAFTARLDHVLAMERHGRTRFAEARRLYRDALAWQGQGRPGLAAVYLERVLELQPNLYTVNCRVADIYRDLRMRKEAARYYSRYLGADIYAYDLDEVKESVRSLTRGSPPRYPSE